VELWTRQEAVTPTWCRDGRALWRRSGATVVLSAPLHDEVVLLEGTAALTWELLAERIDEDELVAPIADHFSVDGQQVREQLTAFLEGLLEYGAVRRT